MHHNTHKNVFTSEPFNSEKEAKDAQAIMLNDWNITTEIHIEQPEPIDEIFDEFDY